MHEARGAPPVPTAPAQSVAALLGLLIAITAIRVAAPAPPPLTHPPAQAAHPPERPEIAVLRRFSRLDLTEVDPEVLLQLRSALRALDPVRNAELVAELQQRGRENESPDEFELYHDPRPRFVWPYRRRGGEAADPCPLTPGQTPPAGRR